MSSQDRQSEGLAQVLGTTISPAFLLGLVIVSGAFCFLALGFQDGFLANIRNWAREEYSHAYLIPFISAYLVWKNITEEGAVHLRGSWIGALAALAGIAVILMGELSTLYPVIGYGFVFVLWGLAWAWLGNESFRRLFPALAILIFTVPLPSFIFNNLSSYLQLISSQIGVGIIRLFDISVYIEGNVIDLGAMKLQVVEACSGLRYLFPLMTLAFIMALFFKGAWWMRVLLFASSFPITVLMNSLRIGIIGVLVEYYGQGMAEGFLHDFEGWVVFMAALGVLALELWVLERIGRRLGRPDSQKRHAADISGDADQAGYKTLSPLLLVLMFVLPATLAANTLSTRSENVPERKIFANFPLQSGAWSAKRELLDGLYLDELDLDDYLIANYSRGAEPVNVYVAWYDTQRKGQSAHSPRTCLPGDGWRIESFDKRDFNSSGIDPIKFNRVVINKGGQRQLVYYWFHQRGRNITNEYLVKWYLFWDVLTQNRTDGALVRFTTGVDQLDQLSEADQRMHALMKQLLPVLPPYLGE